jgi:hypothetical protein
MTEIRIAKDEDRQKACERISRFLLALPEGAWTITVAPYKKRRSDAQNSYLWACYEIIHQETGHDKDELHTWFLGAHFGWTEYEIFGTKRKRPRRTTTKNEEGKRAVLSTVEFMEYIAFIQQKCAEIGIFIPDPHGEEFQNG